MDQISNVAKFLNFLAGNENKMQEFQKLRNKYHEGELSEKENEKFVKKEVLPFAKKNGFSFSQGEYTNFKEKLYNKKTKQIDVEELESVCGGISDNFFKKVLVFASLAAIGSSAAIAAGAVDDPLPNTSAASQALSSASVAVPAPFCT